MTQFDFLNVTHTEFGVGWHDDSFTLIPVDAGVQQVLGTMAQKTLAEIGQFRDELRSYEPSEKYSSCERLYVPIQHENAKCLRSLYDAVNIPTDDRFALEPSDIAFYFGRFVDGAGRRLTAIHRATQFKGVLKVRLISLVTNSLRLIKDRVFKLDEKFDIIIDSAQVYILSPSAFEALGKMKEAILAAAPRNLEEIKQQIPFINFDGLGEYVTKHSRAARYLASILGEQRAVGIDSTLFKHLCEKTGVVFREDNNKITVEPGYEMAFLEVLDRRRFEVELVNGTPEKYRAANRAKL
jgi:hypothetical protein